MSEYRKPCGETLMALMGQNKDLIIPHSWKLQQESEVRTMNKL